MGEIKKRPTIFDVAKLAKVSITTVSRVINKVPTVKESNRIRVEKAIEELSFVPDASAQRLAGGRSLSIGFVLPYYEDMFFTFYGMELLRGVNQGAVENNLDLLSLHISSGVESHSSRLLNTSYISGILFADYHKNEDLIVEAKELNIPYLIVNYFNPVSDDSCIGVDNVQAARDVVTYLIEEGHREIATITGDLKVQAGSDRLTGFKETLRNKNININEDYIVQGNWSGVSGYKGMKQLLSLKQRPTAVFVAGDEMAMEAENAVFEAGLSIPRDISIVGFDDIPLASLSRVPLTTMRQPLFELGRQGIGLLTKILTKEEKPPIKKVLNVELVIRKSCAPPKQ